jgi:hypothetical protein
MTDGLPLGSFCASVMSAQEWSWHCLGVGNTCLSTQTGAADMAKSASRSPNCLIKGRKAVPEQQLLFHWNPQPLALRWGVTDVRSRVQGEGKAIELMMAQYAGPITIACVHAKRANYPG